MIRVGLQVREALHLPRMDRGSACNAYAVISIDGRRRFRTEVMFDSYNAKWNQSFDLSTSATRPDELRIEIFDSDGHEPDDCIGRVRVPGRDLLRSSEKSLPVLNQDGAAIRGKDGQIAMLTIAITAPGPLPTPPPANSPAAAPLPLVPAAANTGPATTRESTTRESAATIPLSHAAAAAVALAPAAARTPAPSPAPVSLGMRTTPRPTGQPGGLPPDPATRTDSADEAWMHVQVLIDEVENLPRKDPAGTCDPYAVATVGEQRASADVVWNSCNAKWRKEFDVEVSDATGTLLVVEVMDRDRLGTVKDDLIGTVKVDLLQLIESDPAFTYNGTVEKRLPVVDEGGAAVRGKNGLIAMLALGFRKSGDAHARNASPAVETRVTHPAEAKTGAQRETAASDLAKTDNEITARTSSSEPAYLAGTSQSSSPPLAVNRAANSSFALATTPSKIQETALNVPPPVQSVENSPQKDLKLSAILKHAPDAESPGATNWMEPTRMKLTLKDVENLPEKDALGTRDAYAIATVGTTQRFMTDVILSSYHAQWNKECDLLVGASVCETLIIEIYDRDKVGTDYFVGEVKVDLRLLLNVELAYAEDGCIEKRFPVADKNGDAVRGVGGLVTMLTLIFRSSAAGALQSKTAHIVSPLQQQQQPLKQPQCIGHSVKNENRAERFAPPELETADDSKQLTISFQNSIAVSSDIEDPEKSVKAFKILVKEVEHLPKREVLGNCDAFAVISVNGKQLCHTEVIWNSFYAKWNQQFALIIVPSVDETLFVEVFDKGKVNNDDLIGTVKIDLCPLVNSEAPEEGWLEKRYPVLDKNDAAVRGKSGRITMLTLGFNAPSDSNLRSRVGSYDRSSPPSEESPVLASVNQSKSSCSSKKKESRLYSFENAVDLELRLGCGMNMDDIKDLPEFKDQVVQDISQAAAIDFRVLQVTMVRAGSIIVDLALACEARDSLGRNAHEISDGLEKQANDPESKLLQGKITKNTISLVVKKSAHISDTLKQNREPEIEDVAAPKASNHAQKMAAKLYSENADLLARLNTITKKLQGSDLINEGGKSADIPAEGLVERLLSRLEDERNARVQADAAFGLATKEAMKLEAEKEEATIDRDFMTNEFQTLKEMSEEQMNELQSLRVAAAQNAVSLDDMEALFLKTIQQNENSAAELAKVKESSDNYKQKCINKVAEIGKLKEELETERNGRKRSDSLLETMTKELETHNVQNDNSKATQLALKDAETTNLELQDRLAWQIEQSKRQEAHLTEALSAEASVKADLESFRKPFAVACKLNDDLKAHIIESEREMDEERIKNAKKVAELEGQVSRTASKQQLHAVNCERLRIALATEQRAKTELEERVLKLQERIVTLQGSLETAQIERQELEAVVASLRDELNGGHKRRDREIPLRESGGWAGQPRTRASGTKQYPFGSPAIHLFMTAALSGTPGKVAKILLGSSERHRLATSDYLTSLLENTVEINRVGKGLQPQDMAEIAAFVLSHPRIERMFLSGNNLGVDGARQLAELLSRSTLKLQRLDLRHNNLGNQGCALLMESLAANESLTRMDLSANGLTSAAADPIALAVRTSRCLLRLDLRHNELGDSGATELGKALRWGARLLHLDLSANAIGMKGAEVN
jgi:hypothetical protein